MQRSPEVKGNNMKKTIVILGIATLGLMGAANARAGVSFRFGGGIAIAPPVVVAPAPYYSAPAYIAPPVCVTPPACVGPSVVLAPPAVVVRPPFLHFGRFGGYRPYYGGYGRHVRRW